MCLIVYKPVGVKLPDLSLLEDAALSNPHGIGFMYPSNDKVEIYKQRMNAKLAHALLTALGDDEMWQATPLVIHFRMATHGDKSDGMCHPFPITDDDELLTATHCQSDIGLAHNGVVMVGKRDATKSDTYLMIQKYLSKFTFETFKHAYTLLDQEVLRADRMIVMNGSGDVIQWGSWNKHESGCTLSSYISSYSWYGYKNRGPYGSGNAVIWDYCDDDYPERGQIVDIKTRMTPKEIEYDAWRRGIDDGQTYYEQFCTLCNESTEFETYYRDDATLCRSCFLALYAEEEKRTRDASEKAMAKCAAKKDGEVWELKSMFSGKYEEYNEYVQCNCCSEWVDKEEAFIFDMKESYSNDPRELKQAVCEDCYIMLELNIVEMVKYTCIHAIRVGKKVRDI